MAALSQIEQLSCGPVSILRLESHRPSEPLAVEELAQWLSIADRTKCQQLVVDCSNVEFMSSDMLSRLVMLQRRMREKGGRLVLCGLRSEVRELLHWTKLDRYFDIRAAAEV